MPALKGLVVSHRGTDGLHLVTGSNMSVRGRTYSLHPLGDAQRVERATEDQLEVHRAPSPGGSGTVLRMILANRRAEESGGGGLSLRCSTMFKPFQFRPLMKYRGEAEQRLLIADETGLGKTIEVGYILAEEYAAGRANRVLILTPRSVVNKWKREMRKFFGINLQAATKPQIMRSINDPKETFHLIASHDVGRNSPRWWEELTGSLDVLVIDEIHRHIGRAKGGKLRRPMAMALSALSRGVIGMTATPVQIDRTDLSRIMDVINPGMYQGVDFNRELRMLSITNELCSAIDAQDLDVVVPARARLAGMLEGDVNDVVPEQLLGRDGLADPDLRIAAMRDLRALTITAKHMTRARGIDPDVDEYTDRTVHPTIWVDLEGDEGEIFDAVDQLFQHSFSHLHRQQLTSSLIPMNGLLWNGGEGARSWSYRNNAGFAFENDDEPEVPMPAHDQAANNRCNELAKRIDQLGQTDTKYNRLANLIRELPDDVEKVVLFTHWRPTWGHLNSRLRPLLQEEELEEWRLFSANPDWPQDRLENESRNFQRHEGNALLLCTDRLSEGVDLHAANCVINYDLPYNPQSLQQRIGRVDRITQEAERIHVYNLAIRGSIDERIMDRLIERAQFFIQMVGDMQAATEEMIGTIIREGDVGIDEEEALIRQLEDREELMDGDMAFRLVDRVFDDEINEARGAADPLHSRDNEVLRALFRILSPGGESEWDEENSTLHIQIPANLASTLIDMLDPHELGGEVTAALQRARQSGNLILCFKGRNAHLGPVNRMQTWATESLSYIEGMYEETVEEIEAAPLSAHVEMGRVKLPDYSEHRWEVAHSAPPMNLGEIVEMLSELELESNLRQRHGEEASDSFGEWVESVVDLDMAERTRLHQAKLRQLHAIRIRLEGEANYDALETIQQKIADHDAAVPENRIPDTSIDYAVVIRVVS